MYFLGILSAQNILLDLMVESRRSTRLLRKGVVLGLRVSSSGRVGPGPGAANTGEERKRVATRVMEALKSILEGKLL